jgi:FlaA1/EpsC-like NDP-sugar epimerase
VTKPLNGFSSHSLPGQTADTNVLPGVVTTVAPPVRQLRSIGSFRLHRGLSGEAIIVGSGTGVSLAATLLNNEDRPYRMGHAATIPAVHAVHRVETRAEAIRLLGTLPAGTIVVESGTVSTDQDAYPADVPVFAAWEVLESTLGRSFPELMPAASAARRSPWLTSTARRVLSASMALGLLAITFPLMVVIAVAVAVRAGGRWPVERRLAGGPAGRADLARWRRPVGLTAAAGRSSLAERLNAGRLGQLPAMVDVLTGRAVLVGPAVVPDDDGAVVLPGVLGWDLVAARGIFGRESVRESYDVFYLRHARPQHDLRVVLAWVVGLPGALIDLFHRASDLPAIDAVVRNTEATVDAGQDVAAIGAGTASGERPTPARALIVGAGSAGQFLAVALPRRPDIGLAPLAFVDDQARLIGRHVDGLPVLGTTVDIPELVAAHDIETVVIAIPSAKPEDLARIVAQARRSTARVLTMPDIGTLLRAESTPIELRRVDLHEVLGRPPVEAFAGICNDFIAGKRVMITGAAGSIGQELTRQVARLDPQAVIALDINETGLFDLNQELVLAGSDTPFHVVVASVTNTKRLESIFSTYKPDIVFHAAAYKHVPMMEKYPQEAVFVNAIGSRRVAEAAARAKVERFVLVSTDKAVRPSSVMGATKRTAELAVKAVARETGMSACAVRFGNVLGSRGSVIPTFERQIDAGGPVTVTDPNMRRFFMTIPEAASLTIQAGAFGDREAVYMLDMGEEVAILDLARRMIELRGLVPGRDIEIVYTGLRPGEKLREELSLAAEVSVRTAHSKIAILQEPERPTETLRAFLSSLDRMGELALTENVEDLRAELFRVIIRADRNLVQVPSPAPVVTHIPGTVESGEDVDPIAIMVAADAGSVPVRSERVVHEDQAMRSAG